jgi:hypothetical protein
MASDNTSESPKQKEFQINEDIANWLDKKANSIDLTLAGKRYSNKSGDSRAALTQEVFWEEVEGVNYRLDIDLDLSLPNFEDKYKIMLSNYNRNRIRRSNYSRGIFRRDRDNDYGATISFLEKLGDFDVAFEPRLQFNNGFGTFYNLKFENQFDIFTYKQTLETRFEFFADSVRGTGQFVALNYEHVFSSTWAFSFIFEEEYQDANNIFRLLQGLNIFYRINNRMFLNNSLVVRSSNRVEARGEPLMKESFRLQEVALGPSFTHEFYKEEIHYSISYTHIWNREQEFTGFNAASFILSFIY